jgi:DNA-binding Lrp family transcriptional regulator
MDKIEQEIMNIILSHPPLRASEIAKLLHMSRQKAEYHLKKMLADKILHLDKFEYDINFKKYFEIND